MAEGIQTSLFSSPNLQWYYRFNSGALTTDSKGSFTLTSHGSPSDTSGKYGNGVDLNTSSYFSRSSSLTSDGESFSISFWVKDSSVCLFSSNSGSYEFYIQNIPSTSKTSIHLEFTSGSLDFQQSYHSSWNNSLWCFFVLTVEQSGGNVIARVYHNANLVETNTQTGKTIKGLSSPYYFSYYHAEGKGGSYGKFDDCMFFKNKVLTQNEINELFFNKSAFLSFFL